ncbi:MAG TPA: hypothetical protein VID27_11165 [Blastocatellia bacterium]
MSLKYDWYIYHSKDDTNWFLEAGGPYTEEESLQILKEDVGKREDITHRIARVSYPQGAIPDKRIERTGLDLANQDTEPEREEVGTTS